MRFGSRYEPFAEKVMSLRRIKRRVSRLYYERFHTDFIRRTTEDIAWLNIVPVGREFGSPDYDRLAILDMFTWGRLSAADAMRLLGVDEREFIAMVEKDELSRNVIEKP